LSESYIKEEGKTVREFIVEAMSTVGENIVVGRIATLSTNNGVIGAYVHSDGKKGSLVVAEGGSGESGITTAKEIAMQAVALRAPYLNRESVPAEVLETEKELYRKQAADEGKPEEMQNKIAEGRVSKYYKENTLLEQAFIKDDKKSVQQVAKDAGAVISQFVRFEVGQAS